MSPDARLIAASVLAVIARREDGTYKVNAEDVSRWVADLELAIPDTFQVQEFSPEAHRSLVTPEPGIRGMVPVALVRDWLRDIHAKVLGAEAGQEAIAVESITWKYAQELNQFSGDA